MVSFGVDISNVEPHAKYEPVPPGKYQVRLVDAAEKSDGGGEYINLQFEVLKPEQYSGKKIFDKLRLEAKTDKARVFAQRRLAALVRACGMLTASDTEQLLMKPLMVDVVVKKSDGYDPQNEIKSYLYENEPTQTVKPPSAGPATNKAPWAEYK